MKIINDIRTMDMVNKFLKIRVYLVGMQTLLFLLFLNFNLCAQNINLKIHIKGVYTTKISLLPLSGANALKPFIEKQNVRNGQVITLLVPKDRLPGQFILRFDYQEKESSTPYPSERYFYINNQNLEFWVQPKAVNNPDSSYFQKGEKENALFVSFSKENGKRKEQLGLLQSFLMNYDQPQSKFYLNGIEEYENRRKKYNQWVSSQIDQHKDAFVSCTFPFQYVEPIVWKGTEQERMSSLIAHYFDDMDFKDPMLVKTADLKDWMNKYVNLYGAMSTTVALRDSLFTVAGQRAIEKASHGNPSVYGWMVDYFYAGYESFGIKNGMTMLQQYINDPNCLTSKKQQIIKRLDGMEKLVAGTLAPDFTLSYIDGSDFNFHIYKGTSKYKLLLFWSADCSHCDQLVTEMTKWYNETGNNKKINIIAVSLDETETEVKKWENKIITLPGWKHLRVKGGINATVANDYAILSTPVMFLVESESNIIVDIPNNLEQLIKDLGKL